MYRRELSVVVGVMVSIALMSCLFTLTSAGYAQITSGQKVETKGLILTRSGDDLTVDTKDLGKVVVVLKDDTKVQVEKGIFRHDDMEVTSLIPGLNVEVKGVGDEQGQIVAEQIRFSKDSLKVARQVQAATEATRSQVATNAQQNVEQNQAIASNAAKIGVNAADIKAAEQRFDNLTEFDVKKELTINFATGEATIPEDAKQQLVDLVKETKNLKGYLIQVRGFASTSGDPEANQKLSDDRADAVVTFLHQQGVDLRHIVTPAAMGTTSPVAANDTEQGRLQNQRVEVKILVNRGLAGK